MTESELLEVHGIGPSKFEKYGKELLEMIKVSAHDKEKIKLSEIKELLTERSLLEAEFGEDPVAEKKFDFFINSKQEKQDDAFIAFKGASFDRHDVLEQLQDKGVELFIIDNKDKLPKDLAAKYLLVRNSREGLDFS